MGNAVQHIAITLDNGSLEIMSFFLDGRSDTLPRGAVWDDTGGTWTRKPSKEAVDDEIERTYAGSKAKPTKYRLIDFADIPTDRSNRANWKDDGKKIG